MEKNSNTGAAYIFNINNSTVTESHILTAFDADTGDYYGISVAISENYVVVGADWDDDSGIRSGSIYLYETDGTYLDKTNASDGEANSWFGYFVSLSDDYVAVGSPDYAITSDDEGHAYVFRIQSNKFVEKKIFFASDFQEDDYFGWSVFISGNYLVVGAYREDSKADAAGAAYVYNFFDGLIYSNGGEVSLNNVDYYDILEG